MLFFLFHFYFKGQASRAAAQGLSLCDGRPRPSFIFSGRGGALGRIKASSSQPALTFFKEEMDGQSAPMENILPASSPDTRLLLSFSFEWELCDHLIFLRVTLWGRASPGAPRSRTEDPRAGCEPAGGHGLPSSPRPRPGMQSGFAHVTEEREGMSPSPAHGILVIGKSRQDRHRTDIRAGIAPSYLSPPV